MNNEFEQIKNAVKNIKLASAEKEKMRTFILEKIQSAKFEQNNHVTNTFAVRLYRHYQNIKNYYFMNNKYKFIPIVAVFLIVILLGGTSAFAEMAVPGDLLYGVKVSVNEPVAGLFAFTKEEKTEWRERLVERRLNEAQKLVSANSLDEEGRLYLEGAIQRQIDDFNASAEELAKQNNESTKSSDINIRLQAALAAHQDVLLAVSNGKDVNAETKQETDRLLSSLAESQNRVRNGYDDLESSIDSESTTETSSEENATPTTTSTGLALAQEKQKTASDLLNSMKLLYQRERNSLSIKTQNSIDGKLAEIETTFKAGEALIASSDFNGAASKFQSAMSLTDAARLLLLSNTIKGDIEDDMGIEDDDGQEIEDDNFEEDNDYINQNQGGQNSNTPNNFDDSGQGNSGTEHD
ncbi:MAG: hypothetical protein WC609_01290 [Candidatus Paceibacterota bacterium]|jgi:hypothetical protein